MPLNLQVIRASEFVCLDPKEHLDFEASKHALRTLAMACLKRGLDRAMLDLRSIPVPDKPKFTPSELATLVRTFLGAGFGRQVRLAVLYRSDPHGGVRTFAFIGRIQGWQVRAFGEFEEALYWLSDETGVPAGVHNPGIMVPITQHASGARKLSVTAKSPPASPGGNNHRAKKPR